MVKPDSNRNSGNLGFEAELFKAADKLRGIEKEKEALKGVLPKDYARPAMNKVMIGRVFEYFIGLLAGAEGKIRSAF
jgi:hypothetical protein